MFPNNVGRFVLDGVMNAHEYYAGACITCPFLYLPSSCGRPRPQFPFTYSRCTHFGLHELLDSRSDGLSALGTQHHRHPHPH